MTQRIAWQEKSNPDCCVWIPTLQDRMRAGYWFTTATTATNVFSYLLYNVTDYDDVVRQLAVIDCLFGLAEGAHLAVIDEESISALASVVRRKRMLHSNGRQGRIKR